MDHPSARRRLPWGALLTCAALASILLLIYRRTPLPPGGPAEAGATGAAPTVPTLAAAILAATFAFLAGRGLLNSFWGVVLAAAVALHPLFFHLVKGDAEAIPVQAVELACLALLVTGWPAAFSEPLRWRAWLAVLLGLSLVGALAWPLGPTAGLVVATTQALVLGTAFLLALLRRRAGLVPCPGGGNVALALLVGVAAPALGVALAPGAAEALSFALAPWPAEALGWLGLPGVPILAGGNRPASVREILDHLRAVTEPAEGWTLAGFGPGDLGLWCWPTPWVVLPLGAWGLWRAVRRGRKQWAAGRAPVGWVLPLFAAVVFLGTVVDSAEQRGHAFLALAVLGVLLSVYCLGDLARGVAERMMLGPPQEEPAAPG